MKMLSSCLMLFLVCLLFGALRPTSLLSYRDFYSETKLESFLSSKIFLCLGKFS